MLRCMDHFSYFIRWFHGIFYLVTWWNKTHVFSVTKCYKGHPRHWRVSCHRLAVHLKPLTPTSSIPRVSLWDSCMENSISLPMNGKWNSSVGNIRVFIPCHLCEIRAGHRHFQLLEPARLLSVSVRKYKMIFGSGSWTILKLWDIAFHIWSVY